MVKPPRPDWWEANKRIRDDLGLPPYDPPELEDGVPVHDVRDDFKDIDIQLIAFNPKCSDDWEVRINGEEAFTITRHRDTNGNTVFGMTSAEFRCEIRTASKVL